MFKKISITLLLLIAVLITIVVTRTLLLTPSNTTIADAEKIGIDQDIAVKPFSDSIHFKTISLLKTKGAEEYLEVRENDFQQFHSFLQSTFPLTHRKLTLTKINKHSLLYRWNGSQADASPIVLTGHQDVVPVSHESLKEWKHNPFSGDVVNGEIWGRGTLDDKSSVIATLEAVEWLLSRGFTPKRTIYLSFGHDEETGGSYGAKEIAKYLKEKGVKPAFVLDEGGFVVRSLIPGVKEPVGLIGIAEKGYMNLLLSVDGEEGHSSMPPKQTAIGILSAAITKMEASPFPSRYEGATEQLFDSVSPYMPFKERMVFANLWLFKPVVISLLEKKKSTNATIRSTFATTIIIGGIKDNILPSSASATINIRLLPDDSVEDIIKYALTIIDDERVIITTSNNPNEATKVSSIDSSEYKSLARVVQQTFKQSKTIPAPFLTINGTDSKHFVEMSENTYRFLPISLDSDGIALIHGVNERISIDSYMKMIQFYVALIKDLDKN